MNRLFLLGLNDAINETWEYTFREDLDSHRYRFVDSMSSRRVRKHSFLFQSNGEAQRERNGDIFLAASLRWATMF